MFPVFRWISSSFKPALPDQKVKEQLVCDLADKSYVESEVLVSQVLNMTPKESVREKHQRDESVRLEVTFTRPQWEKLVKMRELLSSSLPGLQL